MIWPEYVNRNFQGPPINDNEADYHGAYNKLLHYLFPPESDFIVTPGHLHSSNSSNSDGTDISFEVSIGNKLPVFILQSRASRCMDYISTRQAADLHIRQRMGDLAEYCPIPRLHAVSAIGNNLCFYHLTTEHVAPEIIPLAIPQHLTKSTDTAPVTQWDCEIPSVEGERRLQKVVDEIKAMTM
ncbi:hypothetical protein D9615_003415 [Tricholomella constricta]|uniref:Uncharacterized protein n=1 Tax=Tricholomella constricta TaxID=117010 RepID=A0A8H5M887_9AGAR|nr:hypothetical protein D9615_003415 [Tricholomella constricta]